MLIGGIQKMSLIDYPGKIAAIVFTIGCNFRCSFCYNFEIVMNKNIKEIQKISENEFFDFLKTRVKKLEAVCITGGEPTLQKDLVSFIKKIKELGFLVKLDTNGTDPKILKELIDKKMVDYVAMDVKQDLVSDKYDKITQVKVDLKNIKKSIKLLLLGRVDYEFRTTVATGITKEDLINISKFIFGAKRYYLQDFKDAKVLNPKCLKKDWLKKDDLEKIAEICERNVKICKVR